MSSKRRPPTSDEVFIDHITHIVEDINVANRDLLLFGFLDNFGFGGGGNTFLLFKTIGKPDLTSGIIFTITGIILFKFVVYLF